jgi:DNA-binding transcriptional regulator GbsR (MarR family)
MDGSAQDDRQAKHYTTPHRVQAWFLSRSRARWKRKYKDLKIEAKRLQNRVNDVSKSRAKWREEAEHLHQRVQQLKTQNAALHQQVAAKKKGGTAGGARSGG